LITAQQLQPILAQWQAATVQLAAIINAALVSPSGTMITPASGGSLVDINGNVWTFASGGSIAILMNGTTNNGGAGIELEIDVNGIVWAFNNARQWYKWSGTNWVQQATGPTT
jgi:hypothetical protein